MSNVTFLDASGLVVGYNMSIIDGEAICSEFTPTDTSKESSFITANLIQSVFKYVSTNNAGWKDMRLNSSNTKSDVFQFYMFDLEEIIPDALTKYPSLLTKTEANCSLTDYGLLNIDLTYKLIKISMTWSCDLLIYNTSDTSDKLISICFSNVDV
jgi:hypothetical protein